MILLILSGLLFGRLLGYNWLRQSWEVMLVCLERLLLVLFVAAFNPVEFLSLSLDFSSARVFKHVETPTLGI